jgi:hypothetical protein
VLVAPVADAARFAAVCAALRLDVDAVPVEAAGVAAVLHPHVDGAAAVRALSRVLGRAEVLLLVRTEGQVVAERWRAGALQDAPAPGLLLSGLPGAVERLVLGDGPALAEPGAVSSADLPRGRFRLVGSALAELLRRAVKPARRGS